MKSTLDLLNQITDRKKSQAISLLPYLKKHDESVYTKVRWCASFLHIREWIETGETRLTNANFCKRHQICSSCAVRRGARLCDAALPKILSVMDSEPNLKPIHVTLTLKNTEDLQHGFDSIREAWSKMVTCRRKALSSSGRHKTIEWCKVQGGVKSLEVTNKGKGWHPHIHVLALVDEYLDLKKLSTEFESFGGGKIVWATRIFDKKLTEDYLEGLSDKQIVEKKLVRSLLEVLKYPTKFSDLVPEQMLEFYHVARKARLTDTFGCLRGVNIGDIDQDNIDDLSGETRDWIARWYHKQQRYRLTRAELWESADDTCSVTV